MINSIEEYLALLKQELAGSDRATIQDALADAEEYLRTAQANAAPGESLESIMEKYGSPKEIATAYKSIEINTVPSFGRPASEQLKTVTAPPPPLPVPPDTRPWWLKFFGVYGEGRAWGSFFYLIFSLGLGIAYFTWAVTGFATSVGLLVLIIGLPLFALFLMSARGIALVEGRLIEAMTGVRMPRRPLFSRKDIGWWQKFKQVFTERQTWTAVVYMILMLPLGVIYFTVIVSLFAVAIGLIFKPLTELAWGIPTFWTGDYGYYTPTWLLPFASIAGIILLFANMHIAKYIAKGHAVLAKSLLVRE